MTEGVCGWRLAVRKMQPFPKIRVTGDGHRDTGFSGASRSAFGCRLRIPAAEGREADGR